jgi:hypothetical protein
LFVLLQAICMESFIATMSPLTGPEIGRCSTDNADVRWLVKYCLTDQGAPNWNSMDSLFDVKYVAVEQVKLIACFFLLREVSDDVHKQHLVPQYCAGVAFEYSEAMRLPFVFPLIRDRLFIVGKKMLRLLRTCCDDMTAVPSEVVEFLWFETNQLKLDCELWLKARVSRGDFENDAMSLIFKKSNLVEMVSLLSRILAQRCVIIRSSSIEYVKDFTAFVMLLLPDEKLLLASLNPSQTLDAVGPGLFLQCTTLAMNVELVQRSMLSPFPTAIIDLDEDLHVFPPSISEAPVEWIQARALRDQLLLDGSAPRITLSPTTGTSKIVEEVISSLFRCRDHSLCLARWHQRMKLLSLRCVSCEIAGDSSLVPPLDMLDSDIFLNFANFTSGQSTIKRKVNEAGTKFDDF